MSAPRWLVVASTLVVASPLLGLLRAGDVDATTALLRVGVAAVACWAALGLVWTFLLPDPVPARRTPSPTPTTPDGAGAEPTATPHV